MKFFLYLGFVITTFAIGECLRCYNCFQGSISRNDQIRQLINEYGTQPPNERCSINNGEITGPICESLNKCVDMDVDTNNEKAVYHFCSNIDKFETTRSFTQSSGNEYIKANFNLCSKNLCNSASSIFHVTSLVIILLITLFFA